MYEENTRAFKTETEEQVSTASGIISFFFPQEYINDIVRARVHHTEYFSFNSNRIEMGDCKLLYDINFSCVRSN